MSKSTSTQNSSCNLPSFLGPTPGEEGAAPRLPAQGAGEPENYGGAALAGRWQADSEADYDENVADENSDQDGEDPALSEESDSGIHHRYQATHPTKGLGMALGLMITAAGCITAAMPTVQDAMAGIIEPQIVAVLGLALFAIAAGQRGLDRMQQKLERVDDQHAEVYDQLLQILQGQDDLRPDTDGTHRAVQHLAMSLQRQDQKINNLTKAIKMYGQPLMEIANQGTDLAGSVAQVKTVVEGASESTRQAVNRVEQQVRNVGSNNGIGDLPQQIDKLEMAVTALTHRTEDAEVHKSLTRLEDASKEITQLREKDLDGLGSAMKDIQRELSGLAMGISQLQAAVKNGDRSSAPLASPPAASVTTQSPVAPTTTLAQQEANPLDQANGYSTGSHKSAGKDLLGAIAKLKQMKN